MSGYYIDDTPRLIKSYDERQNIKPKRPICVQCPECLNYHMMHCYYGNFTMEESEIKFNCYFGKEYLKK